MKGGISAILCFALLLKHCLLSAQNKILVDNLQKEISYLASDKLEGRNTGEKGEKLAYQIITKEYKTIGIEPKGSKGFLQPFTFNYGKKVSGKNELVINGVKMFLNEDYYPINRSSNGSAKGPIIDVGFGIDANEINYHSYQGIANLKERIFLMESSTPEGDNPHSKFAPYADVKLKIETAIAKGAAAIIFTNTLFDAEDLKSNLDINTISSAIPVVFIKSSSLKKALNPEFNNASMSVHLQPVTITGHNIVGFIDNRADQTVVIGAHYDHLGYGEYGNTLDRGTPAIHNGADDNASGTAAVIELARFLKNNERREKNNYLFINFSGEELGLIGSKYWVEHATVDTSSLNYMINMDMIGRYRPDKGVEISGLGTSPEAFAFIRQFNFDSLKIKPSQSGTGPSDHTSFYYANVPVLNFFTGPHEDYHKPSDDADKINYEGEAKIIRLIRVIIDSLDDKGTLPFIKTKDSLNMDVPQFKVRLGIIPDYMFEGPGLRVDGVNEDQPAAKAGIQKGDIIISIGSYQVGDIMAYMKALAGFHKGDSADVVLKREGQEIKRTVTF